MKVSTHMITYQHAPFIHKALSSAVTQSVDFSYEIVVGDDASDDGTAQIISEYAENHKNLVKPWLHKTNLGRKGENNFLDTLEKCEGEYIAFLEGDDYWTSSEKLKRQVEFLDRNPDVVGCFHNAIVIDEQGEQIADKWFDDEKWSRTGFKRQFDQESCIRDLGSSYPTCGLMLRRSSLFPLPEWYRKSPSDFVTDVLVTQDGMLAYVPMNYGAYRIHANGLWQSKTQMERDTCIIEQLQAILAFEELSELNKDIVRKKIDSMYLKIGLRTESDQEVLPISFLVNLMRDLKLCQTSRRVLTQQAKIRGHHLSKFFS